MREYSNLMQQTAEGNNKTISPHAYAKISAMTAKILKYLSPEAKNSPPLQKLLEIEKSIEIADACIQDWQISDKAVFDAHVKEVKDSVKEQSNKEKTAES